MAVRVEENHNKYKCNLMDLIRRALVLKLAHVFPMMSSVVCGDCGGIISGEDFEVEKGVVEVNNWPKECLTPVEP